MVKAMERANHMECWDSYHGSEEEVVVQSRRNQGFLEEKERELSWVEGLPTLSIGDNP
jgi:hypothetical protein